MNPPKQRRIGIAGVSDAATKTTYDPQETPPPYLKLIADCWEHIYDYLSIKDILVMGQTCKRMNQMSGYYIREYLPQVEFYLDEKGVKYRGFYIQSDFYRFIGRLLITKSSELKFILNVKLFDALKTIVFFPEVELTEVQIESMQDVLKNVETFQLMCSKFTNSIFGQLSNYCPKLKHLDVLDHPISLHLTGFFIQYYPTLESLRYISTECLRINELKMFLEKHTKLKQLVISYDFLWTNRDALNQTNIQLDLLHVCFNTPNDTVVPINEFAEFMYTLYERGFYKTLQLSLKYDHFQRVSIETLRNMVSPLPQFDRLFVCSRSLINLNQLSHLKSLHIGSLGLSETLELETLAKNLPNLEQLDFYNADNNEILPFIRYSKKLHSITALQLNMDSSLNLNALNEERKKLPNACKTKLWIPDGVYLPTKWKWGNLCLNLIQITRKDTFSSSLALYF